MEKYIEGKGIYVGTFDSADLDAGRDRTETERVMAETGYGYTNTEIKTNSRGEPVGLNIYVCKADDIRV